MQMQMRNVLTSGNALIPCIVKPLRPKRAPERFRNPLAQGKKSAKLLIRKPIERRDTPNRRNKRMSGRNRNVGRERKYEIVSENLPLPNLRPRAKDAVFHHNSISVARAFANRPYHIYFEMSSNESPDLPSLHLERAVDFFHKTVNLLIGKGMFKRLEN